MVFENGNIPNTLLCVIMVGVHPSSSANPLLDNMLSQSSCIHDSASPLISFSKTKQFILNQQLSSGATKDQIIGDNPFIFSSSASPSRNLVCR